MARSSSRPTRGGAVVRTTRPRVQTVQLPADDVTPDEQPQEPVETAQDAVPDQDQGVGDSEPAEDPTEPPKDDGGDTDQNSAEGGTDAAPSSEYVLAPSTARVRPPVGRILKAGEPLRFDGTTVGPVVVANEDVFREVYPRRSKRPIYTLVLRKGMRVPSSTLRSAATH